MAAPTRLDRKTTPFCVWRNTTPSPCKDARTSGDSWIKFMSTAIFFLRSLNIRQSPFRYLSCMPEHSSQRPSVLSNSYDFLLAFLSENEVHRNDEANVVLSAKAPVGNSEGLRLMPIVREYWVLLWQRVSDLKREKRFHPCK
jgi:hypothetical protein